MSRHGGIDVHKRLVLIAAAGVWVVTANRWEPPIEAGVMASTLVGTSTEICLMPREHGGYGQTTRGGGAGRDVGGVPRQTGNWLPEGVRGGDVMPARTVFD